MIIRSSQVVDPVLFTDVAIVGSGATGATIAQALEAQNRDVLLIEGGGFDVRDDAQSLFSTTSLGVGVDLDKHRYRVFGGSTVAWTGRCAPLDPIDFEHRDWVKGSGWPISRADLVSYYSQAAQLIGLDEGDAPEWFKGLKGLPARPDAVEPFLWRLNAVKRKRFMNFGKTFQRRFEASRTLRVLLEADLVGIEAAENGSAVTAGLLRGRDGRPLRVQARTWILCCGGIENPRLLMNFAEAQPGAFGPVSKSLGHWFMQHPRARTADIDASVQQADTLQRHFNLFRRTGRHYEAGFALSAETQKRHGLLNASAVLRYSSHVRNPIPRVMLPLRRSPERIVRLAAGWEPRLHKPGIELVVDTEQVPNRDSRVLLTTERDALGLRRAAIDWRIDSMDRRTTYHLTDAVCQWVEGMGLGQARPKPGVEVTGGLTDALMHESYHHLGATRMSRGPDTGVVDGNLKVHGIQNLYVCGGSVLPTGGHANPTLTLVTLALRLAAHLSTRPAVH